MSQTVSIIDCQSFVAEAAFRMGSFLSNIRGFRTADVKLLGPLKLFCFQNSHEAAATKCKPDSMWPQEFWRLQTATSHRNSRPFATVGNISVTLIELLYVIILFFMLHGMHYEVMGYSLISMNNDVDFLFTGTCVSFGYAKQKLIDKYRKHI